MYYVIPTSSLTQVISEHFLLNHRKLIDSIGVVTKADFYPEYSKEYVDKHFEELATAWFRAMNAQIDFGVVLKEVQEQFKEA